MREIIWRVEKTRKERDETLNWRTRDPKKLRACSRIEIRRSFSVETFTEVNYDFCQRRSWLVSARRDELRASGISKNWLIATLFRHVKLARLSCPSLIRESPAKLDYIVVDPIYFHTFAQRSRSLIVRSRHRIFFSSFVTRQFSCSSRVGTRRFISRGQYTAPLCAWVTFSFLFIFLILTNGTAFYGSRREI